MISLAFLRVMTVSASTKRAAFGSDNRRGDPVAYLTGLKVTPFYPVTDVTARHFGLSQPFDLFECYTQGDLDIDPRSDKLTVNGADYPIKYKQVWNRRDDLAIVQLLVERPLK